MSVFENVLMVACMTFVIYLAVFAIPAAAAAGPCATTMTAKAAAACAAL